LFFIIGLLSFEISRAEKRRIWKVFGIFFFYLALDDLFMIHEQVGSFLGEALLKGHFKSYYWHGIYDPLLIFILGLFY